MANSVPSLFSFRLYKRTLPPRNTKTPTKALFKLTRRSTIRAYLSEFEDMTNQIIGLPPSFLLSFFISGLASEIRREVQAL